MSSTDLVYAGSRPQRCGRGLRYSSAWTKKPGGRSNEQGRGGASGVCGLPERRIPLYHTRPKYSSFSASRRDTRRRSRHPMNESQANNELEGPVMRKFDPWEGSRYATEGIGGTRLLILGEANYGKAGHDTRTVTCDMVRELGQKHRFRFYSTVQRLVSGGRGRLSDAERIDFWERVAFYNYIQAFPGPHSRIRPTADMWLAAKEPFKQTLEELCPHVVLVLGVELRRQLPSTQTEATFCYIPHPSSRGVRYEQWQPVIKQALSERNTNPNDRNA